MAHPSWPDLMGSAVLNDAAWRTPGPPSPRCDVTRQIGQAGRKTAAAASIRAARASAALDGAPLALDLDSETVTDPIVAGALRVAAALGSLTTIWPRSPLQALARLHTLAAADLVPAGELGRPRTTDPRVGGGLARLADLVTTAPWPAPVQVALVHGELLSLAPFGHADGVIARAAARLTMISTGLDPAGLGVPEVAHLRSGPRYLELAAGFSTGAEEPWSIGSSRSAGVWPSVPGKACRSPIPLSDPAMVEAIPVCETWRSNAYVLTGEAYLSCECIE